MDIALVKQELSKVLAEVQEFTDYSPRGESSSIEYLYTARKVANCYDRILVSRTTEEAMQEINLVRHYLEECPFYLDFASRI